MGYPAGQRRSQLSADPLGGTTMQAEGTLQLFAELFVAFAGFTGLAGVLTRSEAEMASLRQELRVLIEYSLVFLVLAVLPLVFWHAGITEPNAWRLACGFSALETTTYYALRFSSLQAWSSATGTTALFWATVASESVIAVLLLLAAFQVAPISAPSLYVFHLLWGLIGAALSFARLVKPIWHGTHGSGAA